MDARHLLRGLTVTAVAGALSLAPPALADVWVDHDSAAVTEAAGGNGNGALDPGEPFGLTETLHSNEFGTLTGVTGTLGTTSPDVALSSATAPWPDLTFGAPTANSTPFTATLAAGAECGKPQAFTVDLATSGGPGAVSFSVPTGERGAFASTDALAVPQELLDRSTTDAPLDVAGAGRAKAVRVRVNISHTYMADLTVSLVAPDGTTVLLANGLGGGGQGYQNTVFDQSAATSITDASAPYTGTFRPQGDLSRLDGAPLNGTWTLRVTDNSSGDTGTLNSWGLDLAPAVCAPLPAPPAGGGDDGDDDGGDHGHRGHHHHHHDHGRHRGHAYGHSKQKH